MIPLLIITVCPGLLYLGAVVGERARGQLWPPAIISFFPMQAVVQQLDLLLVALLYGCLFSGALLAATALVLLAFLSGALLVTLALAASDARRLVAAPAARATDVAAANLRLARALAVYAMVRAAVRAALVARAKVAGLASRVARARDEGGWARGRGAMNLLRRGAERFTVVA